MKYPSLVILLMMLVALVGCREEHPKSGPVTFEVNQQAPAPVNPAFTGSVTGLVNLAGAAPKAGAIDMSQDPACVMGANAGASHVSEAFAVKSGKLGNVFVYVKEGLPAGNYGVPSTPVVIDQQGCKYVPHVAGAVAGQTVRFLNSDPTMHNVHPDAQKNSPWNITQTPKGEPIEKSFAKPELMMKVSCNQHPWMRMYLNVVEHPFFAVSDADGKFEIKGLPEGEYVLAAVHERLGERTFKVKVEAKKSAVVGFSF
ncbi:MAG: hypothetical protein ABIP81_00575 [Terriglobales bacterium]